MRNIRTRRHFRLILTLLFAACAVLFVEDRIESFVPELKSFVESRIEEALQGRIRLSIGYIGGGLLHPFTLNEVKVENGEGAAILPSLKISSIKTNYRIWDVFRITRNRSGELDVNGYIDLSSGDRIDWTGKIKEGIYDIEIKLRRGVIRAQGVISSRGSLAANFKIYHIELGRYDITCDGVFKSEIASSGPEVKESVIQGVVEIRNCVLNYKPFLNLRASYRISGGNLFVSDLSLSDIFKGGGTFQLREPFNTNARLTVNNLSLSWLALALGAKDTSAVISGTANVRCDFKGPAAKLRSNIDLEVRDGDIADLSFEFLSAHLKGDGPLIRIEDSRITRESGSFVLAGEMDLRKIGKSSIFENIRLVGDDKAVNWDGWETSKVNNIREVRMKKTISDEIDIDFKKFTSENTIDESLKYADEVQLEYKLHPNDSLKVMIGQDKEFLGIEHKNKF
ncbi:MAG: hypothetical protein Q7S07_02720 [Candidatus Omnitrophota bacterium]|nr:hypothetical protein [Candidatus Omnitrophota bacterium]